MKNKRILYSETHPVRLNVFLIFYIYVFVVLVGANLLPVSPVTYFLFFILGITGIFILLMRSKYFVLIKENEVILTLTTPFRISLLKLNISEIEAVEKIATHPLSYLNYGIKKMKPNCTAYLFNEANGVKLTMRNEKTFIFSCSNAGAIMARINELKEQNTKVT